jgi:divalent metal cation (Fe/Co/Zn/Cd) transporter
MTVLFAHHLEARHVPVLVGLFAAGFFIGWQALSRWLTQKSEPRP